MIGTWYLLWRDVYSDSKPDRLYAKAGETVMLYSIYIDIWIMRRVKDGEVTNDGFPASRSLFMSDLKTGGETEQKATEHQPLQPVTGALRKQKTKRQPGNQGSLF